MTTEYLTPDLKRDEGCVLTAYQDTVGVWTVGYGHAHVAPGTVWTQAQADVALEDDIHVAVTSLDANLPWWRQSMDPIRQDVLANMCFNMGIGTLMTFHNTLQAMHDQRWEDAAEHMLDSKWASQVGARADRLAEQIRTGEHQG